MYRVLNKKHFHQNTNIQIGSNLKKIYANVNNHFKESHILLSSVKENIENILHNISQIFLSISHEPYANLQDFRSAKKA